MAQSVGINTVPNGTAALDVASTTKGMLVPRMTTAQRTAIAAPASGLLVYDATANSFYYYTGTGWKDVSKGAVTSIPNAFTTHATPSQIAGGFISPFAYVNSGSQVTTSNTFYAPESVTLTILISSYSANSFTAEVGTVSPPTGTTFTYGSIVGSAVTLNPWSTGLPQTATLTVPVVAGTIYTMKIVCTSTTTGAFFTNTSAQ